MPHDRKPNPKKRRKLEVLFDDKARSDYLTGFRKRRQERQLKAQNDITKKLKQKVREERTKKRKAAKEKREEILQGVTTIMDNFNDDVTETFTEKVDFVDHEVFVKTDLDFSKAGFLGHDNSENDIHDKKADVIAPVKDVKQKKQPLAKKMKKTRQKFKKKR